MKLIRLLPVTQSGVFCILDDQDRLMKVGGTVYFSEVIDIIERYIYGPVLIYNKGDNDPHEVLFTFEDIQELKEEYAEKFV
jgi:hypothetical protein